MRCRPGGTVTVGSLSAPSSQIVSLSGSAASVICAVVSVATAIVDWDNEASPARAMLTVRPATPVRFRVR